MTLRLLTYRPGDAPREWVFSAGPGIQVLQVSDPKMRRALLTGFCRLLEPNSDGFDSTVSAEQPWVLAVSDSSGMEHYVAVRPGETETVLPACFAYVDPFDRPFFVPPGAIGALSDEECRLLGKALRTLVETGRIGIGLDAVLANLERSADELQNRTAAEVAWKPAEHQERLKNEHRRAMSVLKEIRENAKKTGVLRERAESLYQTFRQARAAFYVGVSRKAVDLQKAIGATDAQLSEAEAPQINSDTLAEIQRAENLTETARRQCQRTGEELGRLDEELASIAVRENVPVAGACLPEKTQREIRHCMARITELKGRLDEVASQMSAVNEQICGVQGRLSELPDFSRAAPDPVDWLTQLARSFKTALHARMTDADERDSLRARVAEVRADIASDEDLFRESAAFAEQMQAHEELKRHWKTRATEATERQQRLRSELTELRDEQPAYFLLTLGCALFLFLLLGVYIGYRNPPVLYSVAMVSVALVYFLTCLAQTYRKIAAMQRAIAENQEALDALDAEEAGQITGIDLLLQRSGARSARELEARYDRYRNLRTHLHMLEERLRRQEQHAQESRERIPMLFERVCAKLSKVDETPTDESDVEHAALRAIAKYQRYREIKRRIADLRNQHQALINRRRYLEKDLAAERDRLPVLEKELRAIMQEGGFLNEADIADIDEAITGYGRFVDGTQGTLGRREWLQQAVEALRHRFVLEKDEYERCRMTFDRVLEEKGFRSAREARELAAKTADRRRLTEERGVLAARLEMMLQGRTLEAMRRLLVESMAGLPESAWDSEDDLDALRTRMQQSESAWENALEAYRKAHGECRGLLRSSRPLSEIEEDIAAIYLQSARLDQEREAAATAAALVQETLSSGRDKFAAMLALRTEGILAAMGHAACVEVELQEDARVYIVTQSPNPEAAGEVSALTCWFALRLAAADMLAAEQWPILVMAEGPAQDAGKDWTAESLLAAMGELGPSRRVLLVAETNDLVEAAERCGLPALRIESV